jgi:hypothetical protein
VRLEPNAENDLDKVSVAQERFVKRVARISDKSMHDIAKALEGVLSLKQQPSS